MPGKEVHSELSHFTPEAPCDQCHLTPDILFPHTLPSSLELALLRDPHSAVPVAQVRSVWGTSRHKPALHRGR